MHPVRCMQPTTAFEVRTETVFRVRPVNGETNVYRGQSVSPFFGVVLRIFFAHCHNPGSKFHIVGVAGGRGLVCSWRQTWLIRPTAACMVHGLMLGDLQNCPARFSLKQTNDSEFEVVLARCFAFSACWPSDNLPLALKYSRASYLQSKTVSKKSGIQQKAQRCELRLR